MGTTAVILAAGKGVRMKSSLPKVMHRVAGKAMVEQVIDACRSAGVDNIVVVVGYGREQIEDMLASQDVLFAVQSEQLGTGHALLQAKPQVNDDDTVLVLAGDTPLLTGDTLKQLLTYHGERGNLATVLTAPVVNPKGYGRIIRDQLARFCRVVEDKDATAEEKLINEINTGVYALKAKEAFQALSELNPNNAQGEYYLTDILEIMMNDGGQVEALAAGNEEEIMGVNDRVQLAQAEAVLQQRKRLELMQSGVTILAPETTFIDSLVKIDPDTIIYPFTIIQGNTSIGSGCEIGPSSYITDSQVGEGCRVISSRLWQAQMGKHCEIGPFAYLRPGSVLEDQVKVGDFVEVKNSHIKNGAKLPHLSYVGDAEVGPRANVGAGTITCNYDGVNKHRTVIGTDAFIGSNTNLVAPVTIGDGATTGAGSTITRDVPPGALAVERADQKLISGWAKKSGRIKKHN
ncbi:MAG: bifunctional UDP-N-acetylglucosamine diphosphorylase/glucosamine-1-phosphate N-acetyltransferase GlmU [Methylocystaceae bacterium]